MTVKAIGTEKRGWKNSTGDFPFEVVHIGEPANNMELFHWHDFMELSFVKEGSGIYEIEDKVFAVSKGDIVIINNIEKHRVTYRPQEPLYETVLHFDPTMIWSNADFTMDYKYLKLFRYKQAAFNNCPELDCDGRLEIQALFSAIESEYTQKKPFYELMIKSRILTIITLLLRQCGINPISDSDVKTRKTQIERLESMLRYIQENFNKEISLESMARAFFMNTSYFSEYFKKNVGVNFSDYLAKVRVQQAIRLLEQTEQNTTEIAYAVGFNNATSFYNTFKKTTGKNPGDYRKQSLPPIR